MHNALPSGKTEPKSPISARKLADRSRLADPGVSEEREGGEDGGHLPAVVPGRAGRRHAPAERAPLDSWPGGASLLEPSRDYSAALGNKPHGEEKEGHRPASAVLCGHGSSRGYRQASAVAWGVRPSSSTRARTTRGASVGNPSESSTSRTIAESEPRETERGSTSPGPAPDTSGNADCDTSCTPGARSRISRIDLRWPPSTAVGHCAMSVKTRFYCAVSPSGRRGWKIPEEASTRRVGDKGLS
jgi:hypothetical protein